MWRYFLHIFSINFAVNWCCNFLLKSNFQFPDFDSCSKFEVESVVLCCDSAIIHHSSSFSDHLHQEIQGILLIPQLISSSIDFLKMASSTEDITDITENIENPVSPYYIHPSDDPGMK